VAIFNFETQSEIINSAIMRPTSTMPQASFIKEPEQKNTFIEPLFDGRFFHLLPTQTFPKHRSFIWQPETTPRYSQIFAYFVSASDTKYRPNDHIHAAPLAHESRSPFDQSASQIDRSLGNAIL